MGKKATFHKLLKIARHCILCIAINSFIPCKAQNITGRIIDLPGSFNRDLLGADRDDEGFIWFVTNEGVWRFDGTDVKLFDYKKLRLPQNTAPDVFYCYKRFLLYCLNGVLRVYDKVTDECHVYDLQSNFYNINITDDGGLLFFTSNGQAWKFTTGKLLQKYVNLNSYLGWEKDMLVSQAVIDHTGTIYIITNSGVGRLAKNTIEWAPAAKLAFFENNQHRSFVSSALVTSAYLEVGYNNGQFVIYNKQSLALLYQYDGNAVACCIKVNDELVFIGNNTPNPSKYVPSPLFKLRLGILPGPFRIVSSLKLSGIKSFLLSTDAGLAEITIHSGTENQYANQAKTVSFFRNKSIRSIYRLNTNLYVGTYSGFYVCSADSIRLINNYVVYSIKQLDSNTLILAIEGGNGFALYDCSSGKFTPLVGNRQAHAFFITALYGEGGYWLGGDRNVIHKVQQVNGNWNVDSIAVDSRLGTIRQIKRIRGNLYVAGQSGLFKMDEQNRLRKIYPDTALLRVYGMQETAEGIWLGTHGNGLVKIDDDGKVLQQVGFNEGLTGNFVYSLTLMNNLLVAGTSNGASIFNVSNGMQPLAVQQDDSLSGLSTEECNHSAIFYDSALQQVILGGVKGLIFVDAKDYAAKAGATGNGLILSYIKTGGHENASAQADLFAYTKGDIILKPDNVNITLKFASPRNPGQTEGLFRIEGLDEKWQRLKIGQEVNLYALPPGTYTLEARLLSSVNSSEWFTKTIIVQPAFYQTVLFKVALGMCFLGIIYLIWRSQVNKIKRELMLRTTIASDLHDDIGSSLSGLSIYSRMALRKIDSDAEGSTALLQKISDRSVTIMESLSDIVWSVNTRNDAMPVVLAKMKEYAAEMLEPQKIEYSFLADEKTVKIKLDMKTRKEFYLIYKEAINNAAKYAGCTHVGVIIKLISKKMLLQITDNGHGFIVSEQTSGNGLINMRERAKKIGADLTVNSKKGEGTVISLYVPIP